MNLREETQKSVWKLEQWLIIGLQSEAEPPRSLEEKVHVGKLRAEADRKGRILNSTGEMLNSGLSESGRHR